MLFEVSRYENGKFEFTPDNNIARLDVLRKALRKGNMIPLKDLITSSSGEALIVNSARNYHAQSYALTRFLREEGYGEFLPDYHRMLLDGLHGNWPLTNEEKAIAADRNIPLTSRWNRVVAEKLFTHYISRDFDAIEKQYLAFCKKSTYRLHREK